MWYEKKLFEFSLKQKWNNPEMSLRLSLIKFGEWSLSQCWLMPLVNYFAMKRLDCSSLEKWVRKSGMGKNPVAYWLKVFFISKTNPFLPSKWKVLALILRVVHAHWLGASAPIPELQAGMLGLQVRNRLRVMTWFMLQTGFWPLIEILHQSLTTNCKKSCGFSIAQLTVCCINLHSSW